MYCIETLKQAKELEKQSKWRAASDMWRKIRRYEDADACILIAESSERGDAYRREVAETIGDEPDFTPTTVREWQQWHRDLRTIYNRHFKN